MNETKNPLWVDSPWIDSENNLTFITDSDGEIWVMGTDPSNPEISIPYSEYTRLRIEGLELANSKDLTFDLKALDAYNEANVNEVVISSGTTEWTLTPDSEYEIIVPFRQEVVFDKGAVAKAISCCSAGGNRKFRAD